MISMNINISKETAQWYKQELGLETSSFVRFYVRYGGIGGNIPGFSLGLSVEKPSNIHTQVTVEDITFYIEESDEWYFDGKDLFVSLNSHTKEPQFTYK